MTIIRTSDHQRTSTHHAISETQNSIQYWSTKGYRLQVVGRSQNEICTLKQKAEEILHTITMVMEMVIIATTKII